MGDQAVVLICRFLAVTLEVPTRQISIPYRRIPRFTFAAIVLAAVTACGGGGSTPPPPPPAMYGIVGTVSGLDAGESVVLHLNGGNDLTVGNNGAFNFATKVASGSAYAVTVAGFPVGKTCTVNGGAGTASANVTSVAVACVITPGYSIGGTVFGLVGQDLKLALRGMRRISYGTGCVTQETLAVNKNGEFVFATPHSSGSYCVGIQQQPHSPSQRCVVRNGNVGIPTANVTDVEVVCSDFSYVTSAADNTISAFSVDATTGAIASVGSPVSTGVSPLAIAGTSNKKYVYVINSGSNNISAFSVNPGTGALTAVPGSPFAAGTNPRALALPSDSFLYVANSGSDDIVGYQIDQGNGTLTPVTFCVPCFHSTGAGPSAIAIGPGNGFLYSANTGSSNISAFDFDVFYPGALDPIPESPFSSGSGVSSLAFGAGGKFLYAADASGVTAAIVGFTVRPRYDQNGIPDPNPGALNGLSGFPMSLPSCTFIVADQTGTYLYAATGTDLLGYSIDALTGTLTLLPGFPIAVGADVRSVSIDPTNQFLYVANGSAGTVTSYTLNAVTGALTLMPGSPFTAGTAADYIATF
jgi:6-phosphogluconolactonase